MSDIAQPGYDPFKRASARTSVRRKAAVRVIFAGQDITNRLMPYLIGVKVNDGQSGVSASIEVDDRDARLEIPEVGADVEIEMGWVGEGMARVFKGATDDLEYSFSREGGRHMTVHAKGLQPTSLLKQPMSNYLGAGAPPGSDIGMSIPFSRMAQKVAQAGGGTISLHPKLAAVTKDYWAQFNESPIHFMERVAKELGGVVRVQDGTHFMFTVPGQDAGGGSSYITARWNDNLLSLRVRPMAAKSIWKGASASFYSMLSGNWMTLAQKFNFPAPWTFSDAVFALPRAAPNSTGAAAAAGGKAAGDMSQSGKIVIVGEPAATGVGGHVMVEGVRPGVDGDYIIQEAEHVYERGTGYITNLTVTINMDAGASTNVGTAYAPRSTTGTAVAGTVTPYIPGAGSPL